MRPDAELRIEVLSELKAEPSLKERRFDVGLKKGVIQVTGSVESFEERGAADRATARVVGRHPFVLGVNIRRRAASRDHVQDLRDFLAEAVQEHGHRLAALGQISLLDLTLYLTPHGDLGSAPHADNHEGWNAPATTTDVASQASERGR